MDDRGYKLVFKYAIDLMILWQRGEGQVGQGGKVQNRIFCYLFNRCGKLVSGPFVKERPK